MDLVFVKLVEAPCEEQFKSNDAFLECGGGGGGGGGSTTQTFKLDYMTAKHHKEDIGRSEVEVKTQAYFVTGHFPLTVNAITNTNRNVQYSYSRRDIRRDRAKYINQRYVFADPIPTVGEIYYAEMIFEWDSWPAPNETRVLTTTLSTGEVFQVNFNARTWQSSYNQQIVNGINSHSYENSSIKYNFRKF